MKIAIIGITLLIITACAGRVERVWPWCTDPSNNLNEKLQMRLTVNYVDEPIEDVISHLSQESGINMIVMPEVIAQGVPPVTFRLSNVRIGTLIDAVRSHSGMRIEVRDDVFIWFNG